jgi:hypothetical protein
MATDLPTIRRFQSWRTIAARFLLAGALCAFAAPAAHSNAPLRTWTFDDGKNALRGLIIQGDKPQIVDDPDQPGNKVMRAVLRPDAARPERSEVMPGVIKAGEERWISARIQRPQRDADGYLSTFQLGPISDRQRVMQGAFQLATYSQNHWTARVHPGRVANATHKIGPVEFGKWETWVFHVRFVDGPKGVIEVWRNGDPVFRQAGMTVLDGDIMRIKWGVYVGKGNRAKQEIATLFDDITIGERPPASLGRSPR